jgi:adenylate kinase
MTVIIVSGTPATGKTTIAKLISEKLGFTYIDGKKVIEKHGLSEGFDKKRDCVIVDVEKFLSAIKSEISGDIVVDSHLAHELKAELVVITTCDRKVLKSRMEARGYSEAKIQENIEAEIFDVCFVEAQEAGQNVLKIDTTDSNSKKIIEKIKEKLN